MNRIEKKGFTIVELVAVLVILGIITGISIPLIRRVQEDNKQKKFKTYYNNLKVSSKLYIDSKEVDLFGEAKSGCSIVSYKDLNEKGLLKDISLDNITCNDADTFVRIVKVNDSYGYSTHIKCLNQSSNTVVYQEGNQGEESCSISSDNIIDVIIKDKPATYVKDYNDIEVLLSSTTGIYPDNVSLQYAFSTTQDESGIVGTWTPLKYSLPSEDEQYAKIERGEKITATALASTPKGYTGELYLLVKVLYLKDLVLDNWIALEKDLGVPLVSNNKYLLDNTVPTGSITSTNNIATSQTATLTMNDGKRLGKYYFGTSNPATSNVSYTNISSTSEIATATVNVGTTYYLRVYDQADNYTDISKVFYNTTLNLQGGTGVLSNIITMKDNSFTVPIPTRSGYSFSGWYTGENGGGVQITPSQSGNYKPTANATLYAKWTGCGAGTYSKDNQCVTCPKDTYSSGAANPSCTACPAGMTSNAGSTAKTACKITCDAGKYLPKSATSCSSCLKNSFCVGGEYHYNDTIEQGRTSCPSGMTSSEGSTAKTNCKITCSAGKYLAKNTTSCATCPANNYCLGGTYYFNPNVNQGNTACPSGYTSSTGANAKNKCSIRCNADTRVTSIDGKCTGTCPNNYFINAHTVNSGSTSSSCLPKTRTITYVGNGNTGGTTGKTTCNYGQSCTLANNGFTKKGYTFDGWYTAANGGTKYSKTTTITTDITVYAHWVDTTGPKLTYSKFNIGSANGISVTITCTDDGVGCSKKTYTYHNLKSKNPDYTIKDKANNPTTITIPVENYSCSYQDCWTEKECETKQGDAYVCGKDCGYQDFGRYDCRDAYCPGETWTECYDATHCDTKWRKCYK